MSSEPEDPGSHWELFFESLPCSAWLVSRTDWHLAHGNARAALVTDGRAAVALDALDIAIEVLDDPAGSVAQRVAGAFASAASSQGPARWRDSDRSIELAIWPLSQRADVDAVAVLALEIEGRAVAPQKWWRRIGHDLRGPIGPMRMAVQLLKTGRVAGADHDEALRLIERQLDQLLENIDDVSELLRAKGGAGRPGLVEGDLALVLDMVAGRSSIGRFLNERGQSLECKAPDYPVPARHDPSVLTSLLEFLIHQMAKFALPGAALGLELAHVGGSAAFQLRGSHHRLDAAPELAYVMAHSGAGVEAEPETKSVLMREFLGHSGATLSLIDEGTGISLTLPALPH